MENNKLFEQKYEVENEETVRVRQLLAKNISDFKRLISSSMREDEKNNPLIKYSRMDVNRISDYSLDKKENLEEWVSNEFPAKVSKPEEKKVKPSRTFIDSIEKWLMNEAMNDLFAQLDQKYNNTAKLSSESFREMGEYLITLSEKLSQVKTK